MTFNEYQEAARRSANRQGLHSDQIVNFALGLCGEAGETAEKIKHLIYHGRDVPAAEIAEELGDVLWYLTNIADLLSYDLGRLAQENIDKLLERYPDGFAREDNNG